MSIIDRVKWGAGNMASYIFFLAFLIAIGYLIWLFFKSDAKIGEACKNHNDCRSRFCLYEEGRNYRYCSKNCNTNSDCPHDWQCLHPPGVPPEMFVCIKP